MFSAVEALLKSWQVQTKRLCVLWELRQTQSILIAKESVVHLPVFPLVSGTARCLLCLERVGMDRFNREAPEDVLDPAVHDVVTLYLWQGLAEVAGGKRGLGNKKKHEGGAFPLFSPLKIIRETENKIFVVGGGPRWFSERFYFSRP